jgi:phosphoenolpyruvate-protein kinase (PTS system EI component)
MVSDVAEIRAAKALLSVEKKKLTKERIKCGSPLVGAMIEVPSAVFMIEDIAKEVDFLCLGTNDLVQYVLAADRDNEAMADMFRSLHPAVIRAIKTTIDAAATADVPITICGEMAGSPFYVPVLLGLGATILSMNVNSIARVRKTIEGIAYEEAREVVAKAMKCRLSEDIEKMIKRYINSHWSHIFELESMAH